MRHLNFMEVAMTYIDPNERRRVDAETRVPMTPRRDKPGWGIPLLFAAIALVAGILVFSTAGPDRTRTAEYNNNPASRLPSASQPRDESSTTGQQPNVNMRTAPKSP
jgi:hypothetical protein